MIKAKIEFVAQHVKRQAFYIWKGKKRNTKGQFIEAFADKIQGSVPEISRETINIITTGFLSELRSLDKQIVFDLLEDGR